MVLPRRESVLISPDPSLWAEPHLSLVDPSSVLGARLSSREPGQGVELWKLSALS